MEDKGARLSLTEVISQTFFKKEGYMKKKQNYKTMDALKQVQKILDEVNQTLADKNRIKVPDDVKEIIGATIGIGAGVGAGIGVISAGAAAGTAGAAWITSGLAAAGGIVGGGMMAGIFVAAAPVAICGVAGYGLVSKINKNRIVKQKELLLKEAVSKHNKIINELSKKAEKSQERIDHLTYLNQAIQKIINNLEADLRKAA